MNKELIINSGPNGARIALLEDQKLVELHEDKLNNKFSIGDIYLGRVKKVLPGLNAAFVDIGSDKDAFLHYTDLGPQIRSLMKLTNQAVNGKLGDPMLKGFKFEKDIIKTGKMNEVLKPRQYILVQILKEPISTKGPRLTCEITIAGRNMVLAPFTSGVGISRRLNSSTERKRLRILLESLKPEHFGVVARTVAQGKGSAELYTEFNELVSKWKEMLQNLKGAKPRQKILSELGKTTGIIRDLLSDSFNKVVTNSPDLKVEIESYIHQIAPDQKDIVSQYKGRRPIFDAFSITKQIKSAFGKTVSMNSGAYLVIEHTEAMHVIDVNSGHKASMKGDQETNALKVNLEAAKEIARQLRLRDLGGLIIIDFIDMRNRDYKKQVQQVMKDAMKGDKATHTILPLSRFNLLQITRQRMKPELQIATNENCPTCGGSGKIEASILIVDELKRDLEYLIKEHSKLKIVVHPFVDAYLKRGLWSLRRKWQWDYKKPITIEADANFAMTDYKFYDGKDEEIKL